MIRTMRNIGRLMRIGHILARHDALRALIRPPLSELPALAWSGAVLSRLARFGGKPPTGLRAGERLALALSDLGPSFIKLGQALSTRSDLVGEQVASDLATLQDSLPPFATKEVHRILERELGQPIKALYRSFDEEPVAAASIAQVHFAVTLDGAEVAVKVLRPDVEEAFARDLELFRWGAEWLTLVLPAVRRLRLPEVVETFGESVRLEMDLRFEAAAAAELRDNFDADDGFHVPIVDWQRTARRVLTLERVSGLPAGDVPGLVKAGIDLEEVLRIAATAFFNQVFRDGYFHADMHPGNLFVNPDNSIAPVDFGIMGRLDVKTRRYLAEMLLGFLTGDYRRVAEVHFRAGYVPAHKSIDSFTQACRSIGEPILGKPLASISVAQLLAQLFEVTELFEMETQPQLLLLQKTMLQAEGIGRMLCPELNMWQLAQPLVEEWVVENLGPQARVKEMAQDALQSIERLPGLVAQLDRATASLTQDGLKLHPETAAAFTGRRRGSGLGGLFWVLMVLLAFGLGLLL